MKRANCVYQRLVLVVVLVAAALATSSAGFVPGASTPAAFAEISHALDLLFVPNGAGGFDARGVGSIVSFEKQRVVFPDGVLRFEGSNPNVELAGVERRPGVVNYLVGEPTTWRTNVRTYGGVVYRGLYGGIDMRFDASRRAWLTATYNVAAGAEPNHIGWRSSGAAATAPVAWQEIDGRRVAVAVRYRHVRTGGFELGRYDANRPLWIRVRYGPQHRSAAAAGLAYSTYLGGTKWDEAYDIEVDRAGNAYVAGFTFSPDFKTARARQAAFGGVVDAFVVKLSADGQTLLYGTYLGGNKTDIAAGIAVDASGNAYVTGRTESHNFPITNARQRGLRGRDCQKVNKRPGTIPCNDVFVTKLGPSGNIRYSTYLGGRHSDEALGIAADRRGNAYVTGNTESTDFPVRRAVQRRFGGLPCTGEMPCPSDVFVTKLSPDGRRILYSTYLGGKLSERSGGLAVDRAGNAYVTGTTRSTNFPTRNALQRSLRGTECGPPPVGCPDVFITKLGAAGTLRYSTYLGGGKAESAGGIAADNAGNAYVTGSTQSKDFPLSGALQSSLDNSTCSDGPPPKELCGDVFVSTLSANGRALRYSTYLAGSSEDQGLGIAVDRTGHAFVVGSTTSRNFRTANAPQQAMGGYIDAFVSELQPDGRALMFSTFLGGTKAERSNAVAVDAAGHAYLTGRTQSPNFPTARPIQGSMSGDIDAFVTKLE